EGTVTGVLGGLDLHVKLVEIRPFQAQNINQRTGMSERYLVLAVPRSPSGTRASTRLVSPGRLDSQETLNEPSFSRTTASTSSTRVTPFSRIAARTSPSVMRSLFRARGINFP